MEIFIVGILFGLSWLSMTMKTIVVLSFLFSLMYDGGRSLMYLLKLKTPPPSCCAWMDKPYQDSLWFKSLFDCIWNYIQPGKIDKK